MRRLAGAVIALAVIAVVGAVALSRIDFDAFREPPASFATFRSGAVEFRHPPTWRASGTDVVRLEPPNATARVGPVAELRRLTLTPKAVKRAERAAYRLVARKPESAGVYEIDVPGAEASSASDFVFKLRDGTQHRVTTVTALTPGGVVSLAVRGRVADGPADPRIVAGSLRLDR